MASNINLTNYEEFFADFIDGNLTEANLNELYMFLEKHPDLKFEFSQLNHISLQPDSTVFENKHLLLKHEGTLTGNIEYDRLVGLLEDDLGVGEKAMLTSQLQLDSQLANDWKLFSMTKLSPETNIVFPNKNLLLKPVTTFFGIRNIVYLAAAGLALFFVVNNIMNPLPVFQYTVPFAQVAIPNRNISKQTLVLNNGLRQNQLSNTQVDQNTDSKIDYSEVSKNSNHVSPIVPVSISLSQNNVGLLQVEQLNVYPVDTEPAFVGNNDSEYKELDQVLIESLKTRAGFNANEKVNFWKITERSINGIAKLTGSNMQMSNTYKDNGKIRTIEFTSALIDIESNMSN